MAADDKDSSGRRHREKYIRDDLMELARQDATVHAALVTFSYGHTTYTRALEDLVMLLATEKKLLQDEAIRQASLDVRPLVFPEVRR